MSLSAQLSLALAIGALAAPIVRAEIEESVPLGLEAVAGIRSGYVYRGFDLAGSLVDIELEGEIVLSDMLILNTGGWLASAIDDDFTELAGFADLRAEMNEFYTLGASLTYHDYEDSLFRDGFDLGGFLSMFYSDHFEVTMGLYHDFAAVAWYAKIESLWSVPLGEALRFSLLNGVSWTDGYYGRDGLNDLYGRAAVTYSLRNDLMLSPFVGWSVEADGDGDGDEVFGGLWIEILF